MKVVFLIKKSPLFQFFILQTLLMIVFVVLFRQFQPQVIYKFMYENQSIHNNYFNKNFDELIFGDNITGFPSLIVPNIVHYVLFDVRQISFAHFISILSVLKNQKPEIIYFHCNCEEISGHYFQRVLQKSVLTQTVIKVRNISKPNIVFDKNLSKDYMNWHSSDITRIRAITQFGGIYLDNDIYVVQSLDPFRKFEMTINWDEGLNLGNQVIIGHRNARFLHRWLDTYREYDKNEWYFNAGELPTKAVLEKNPELVHRLKGEFGVDAPNVCPKIYKMYYKNWKTEFFTVHLAMRNNTIAHSNWCFAGHPPPIMTFNENNIKTLNITFAEMCREVLI